MSTHKIRHYPQRTVWICCGCAQPLGQPHTGNRCKESGRVKLDDWLVAITIPEVPSHANSNH